MQLPNEKTTQLGEVIPNTKGVEVELNYDLATLLTPQNWSLVGYDSPIVLILLSWV